MAAGKKRRLFTAARKAQVLDWIADGNTVDAASKRFGIHSSSIYDWRAKALRPPGAAANPSRTNSSAKLANHQVVVLLRQSGRAFALGHKTKAHLLAMLALETLEGR